MRESIVHFMRVNVQSLLLREILMHYSVGTRILTLTASIYYSCWIICYCRMGNLEMIKSVFPSCSCSSLCFWRQQKRWHTVRVCSWLRWDKIFFYFSVECAGKVVDAQTARYMQSLHIPSHSLENPCAEVWLKYNKTKFWFILDLVPLLCVHTHFKALPWHCKGVWRQMKFRLSRLKGVCTLIHTYLWSWRRPSCNLKQK